MTFPRTYHSIKNFIVNQTLMLASEAMIIFLFILVILAYNLNISIEDTGYPIVRYLLAVMLIFLAVRISSYVFCFIGLRRASKEDANFKIAFYSIVITLVLSVGSLVFMFNKEVSSISELLIILTTMLSEIYILDGIRSLSIQLGHPEMDKTGGVIYAVIITIFVIRTCVSVVILILDDNSATVESSVLGIIDSTLSIIESVLFLFYFSKAIKIFQKE